MSRIVSKIEYSFYVDFYVVPARHKQYCTWLFSPSILYKNEQTILTNTQNKNETIS